MKAVLLTRAAAGVDADQFRAWHEADAVPALRRAVPELERCVRNYVRPGPGGAGASWAAFTELWLDADHGWPNVASGLLDCDPAFVDNAASQLAVVEEVRSPDARPGTAKTMILIGRRSDFSRADFRARYESGHVPLALRSLALMSAYTRNYVIGADGPAEPDFDVVTECWFPDRAAMKQTARRLAEPAVRAAIDRDQDDFMDSPGIRHFAVDEVSD
jgi:hypothetical protein